MTPEDVLKDLVEALYAEEVEFTDWEQKFIEEMADLVGGGGDLTDGQEEKLEEIRQQRLNE